MSQIFGVSGYGRKPRVNLDDDLPADKVGTGLDNGANADAALADLRTANGLPAQAPRFNNATSKVANANAALADLRTANGLPAQAPRFNNATSKGFEESKEQRDSRKRIALEGKQQHDAWLDTADGREAQDGREVGKLIRMGVPGREARAQVQADRRRREATAFEREQVRRDQDRNDRTAAGAIRNGGPQAQAGAGKVPSSQRQGGILSGIADVARAASQVLGAIKEKPAPPTRRWTGNFPSPDARNVSQDKPYVFSGLRNLPGTAEARKQSVIGAVKARVANPPGVQKEVDPNSVRQPGASQTTFPEPNDAAIAYLRKYPHTGGLFDQVHGEGASKQYLG